MPGAASDPAWMKEAGHILGLTLTQRTYREACGPCPKCGGKDRFLVFEDGGSWCRQCHYIKWWAGTPPTPQQLEESHAARAERQANLMARMASVHDWEAYHAALSNGSGEHIGDWLEHGLVEDEIATWGLGYCKSCPLCCESPSLTIPVFKHQMLVDIRHRLTNATTADRYRSHIAGLTPSIFNSDALRTSETILIVEGEKKAILSVRAGFKASLGLPGAQYGLSLLDTLTTSDEKQMIVLALDPYQTANAERLAFQIGSRARVADFPAKPDDYFLRYGAKAYAEVIRQARPVRASRPAGYRR